MRLDEASQLGTTQDVLSSMQLFGIIFKFVFPLIAVLICIEFIKIIKKAIKRRMQRNEAKKVQAKEKEKQQKKIEAAKKKRKQKINKLYKDNEFLMKQLDGTHEPLDKSAYHDLDITFDKNGKAIRQ